MKTLVEQLEDAADPSMYEEAVRVLKEEDWAAARIPVKYLFRYYQQYQNIWYKEVNTISPKVKAVTRGE